MKTDKPGLRALTTSKERQELRAIGCERILCSPVILKRTFNQKLLDGSSIRFWRVIGPVDHRNLNSDLSIDGLKDWGIVR